MSWKDLLQDAAPASLVMPWLGGRRVYKEGRAWRVAGDLPRELGWYEFDVTGRRARVRGAAEMDPEYGRSWLRNYHGYLIGDRLAPMDLTAWHGLDELFLATVPVYLVEPGLDRFSVVGVVVDRADRHIYVEEQFPLGPEDEVRRAFVDKKESIDAIKGVIPALDLAFRFASEQRRLAEERRTELERKREEERRKEEALRSIGTGLGRRTLAATDFRAAADAALKVGGAELLDVRPGRTGREKVVQYRLERRRFECVADRETLQIVDAGICLEDHRSGEKGDTYFTLESLPGVVAQAIREGRLHVYRHVD
jgi:hypothetical protein